MTSHLNKEVAVDTTTGSRPRLQSFHLSSHRSEDGQSSEEYEMQTHGGGGGGGGAALSPRSREYLRLRVNARERQRMHDMNSALDALRTSMPYAQGPAVKKLSKTNTLLLARNYITLLTRTLDELRRLLAETHSRQSLPWSPRLDAAMRNHELYAQQQQFTEELIRREQLQLLQIQQAGQQQQQQQQQIKSVSPLNIKSSSISSPKRKERRYVPDNEGHVNASKKRRISQKEKTRDTPVQKYPDVVSSIPSNVDSLKDSSPSSAAIFLPRHHPLLRVTSPSSSLTSSPENNLATSLFITSSLHEHMSAAGYRSSMPCPCPHCFDGKSAYVLPLDFTSRTRLV